jgi:hypothetical protein
MDQFNDFDDFNSQTNFGQGSRVFSSSFYGGSLNKKFSLRNLSIDKKFHQAYFHKKIIVSFQQNGQKCIFQFNNYCKNTKYAKFIDSFG